MLLDIFSMIGTAEPIEILKILVFTLIAILIAIVCHEAAHALAAYWMGDTPIKTSGRLSLNPLNHLNLPGFLMLLIFGFGWAQPVQVNPRNFRNPRLGMVVTAAAGPLTNFILCFIACFLYYIAQVQFLLTQQDVWNNLMMLFMYILSVNASLGLFNLIPVPPLDGSKILAEILPLKWRIRYLELERFSTIIFVVLIILLNRTDFLSVLMNGLLSLFSLVLIPLVELIYGL